MLCFYYYITYFTFVLKCYFSYFNLTCWHSYNFIFKNSISFLNTTSIPLPITLAFMQVIYLLTPSPIKLQSYLCMENKTINVILFKELCVTSIFSYRYLPRGSSVAFYYIVLFIQWGSSTGWSLLILWWAHLSFILTLTMILM